MRISTATIYDSGVAGIRQQTEPLLKSQQQVSGGKRMLTPADDPVAAARVLELSQSQSLNRQYGVNTGSAYDGLAIEETVLDGVTRLIQDVKVIAVNAGNPSLDHNNRHSLAEELRGRYAELMGLANSTDGNGQYLFSGYQGTTRPFSETAPGAVSYNGDQGQRLIQIGASRQIAVSDAGVDVFQRIFDGNGSFLTQAGGGNTGLGVIDSGNVLSLVSWNAAGNGKDFTIKFAGTATVNAASTNTPGGASGTAGIVNQALWNAGSKNYSITFTSATAYDIIDNTTNTAIVTGGAYTSGATINFQGVDAVITDGAGPVTPQAGDTFTINPASQPGLTYDIVDNTTGKSLLTGLAAGLPPYARSFNSGGSIGFKSQGSEPAFDFGIAATINGAPDAGDTFAIKASRHQDLFKTINDLANLLDTSGGTALTNGLVGAQSSLDNALENLLWVRATVGARMKEADTAKGLGEDLNLQYSQSISRLQDLDYAKAISDLTRQQQSLQAAQQSFVKVSGLSLFNFIGS